MIRHETTKLFYDKYLYKLGVDNPLGFIFRNKNFSHARTVIDDLQFKLEEKETLRYMPSMRHIDVTQDDLHDLKILLSELESASSFMVRCEQRKVGLFSNDDTWLKHVSKKLHCVSDFYEPADNTADLLLKNKNIIIKNTPFEYEFKVTLGGNSIDYNFYNWAKENGDKIRVSPGLMTRLSQKGYVSGKYLYLRDEKVLTLAMLFLSGNITRVDRIVLKQDVDK
jgi:hypothetical protein